MNDDFPIDRGGSIWDGIWRGRASSHRRNLSNSALYAARFASDLREASRLVDSVPSDHRAVEIAGLARQIIDFSEAMRAVGDHLLAEAGLPFEPKRKLSLWSWIRGR